MHHFSFSLKCACKRQLRVNDWRKVVTKILKVHYSKYVINGFFASSFVEGEKFSTLFIKYNETTDTNIYKMLAGVDLGFSRGGGG